MRLDRESARADVLNESTHDNRDKNKAVILCENGTLAKSESGKICGMFYSAFYHTDDSKILHLQHFASNAGYCRCRRIGLSIWNDLDDQKQRPIAADPAVCYGWAIGYSLGSGRNHISLLNTLSVKLVTGRARIPMLD